ncbi:zinc finger CCHC domain-containing protein 8-like [Carassius carassius]|uniref:zinc finger CCHC domain-containing protein 8-like n=1 Tax=Carassius carassius TaxID=217509 RepID=UPI0028689921|nr:zinc finger CCHC domain-containing protein 8-like [Carassius carassius]
MSAVELGESELIAQFEEDASERAGVEDEERLRDTLEACGETAARLKEENEDLKRKLHILSRPARINIEDSSTDGPLCQINYGNNIISRQCRREMEDFICCLVQKRLEECSSDPEASALHVKPHHSGFIMEESYKAKPSSDSKHMKNAFSVIGSVLYFTSFCVDKLGQPLLNENPQLTDGWEVPKYQQIFGQIIALEGQEVQAAVKRPRPCCFNCSSEDHQLRDCPQPKDTARISEKRKEFSQNISPSNQRYHAEEIEERFTKYKPGTLSQELLEALGISSNTLPPFVYRMRELGYPPGWLKEAEMEDSGLTLYDGSNNEDEDNHSQKVSYDVCKLVDFPGFNCSAAASVRDDYRSFGSVPMQPRQWKQNFAAFLNRNFPTGSSCSKRRHESESTAQETKKRRSSPEKVEIESEHQVSGVRSDGFQFPPGSAPPLPPGTPPPSPPIPRDTPLLTPPPHGSPATPARGEESEDGRSLEQQQRLLESSSSRVTSLRSTPSPPDVSKEERIEGPEQRAIDLLAEMRDISVLSEVYEECSDHEAPDAPQTNTPEDEPAVTKVTLVPHRSRFAAGIIPFEDTPEFTEVAEATGVYLKIRDLLRDSPRSQAQNKK